MAKHSGIGEVIGWGVAGLGVYLVGNMFGWWTDLGSMFSGATTTAASTTPAASVVLAGPVTKTLNNALQANVSINGSVTNLAVIPGGDAYNTSGQDVTASLTALGVTAAQVYSLMQAALNIQPSTSTTSTSTSAPQPPVGTATGGGVSPDGSVCTLPAPTTGSNLRQAPGIMQNGVCVAKPLSPASTLLAHNPPVRRVAGMSGGIIPSWSPMPNLGRRSMVHANRRNYVAKGARF
jgi:hypothetical protein